MVRRSEIFIPLLSQISNRNCRALAKSWGARALRLTRPKLMYALVYRIVRHVVVLLIPRAYRTRLDHTYTRIRSKSFTIRYKIIYMPTRHPRGSRWNPSRALS